ncbi:hypothetical protein Syun_014185 [Stephania yunnanensis]|uniref:Uncharacterized protein n=1 Tax=Stephania yunnanensis TaxID=152371 RepID=A0AAP0JJM7_9MAGN
MPSFKTPFSDEFMKILTSKLGKLQISSDIPSPAVAKPQPSSSNPPSSKDKGPAIMTLSPAQAHITAMSRTESESHPAESPTSESQPDSNSETSSLPEIHRLMRHAKRWISWRELVSEFESSETRRRRRLKEQIRLDSAFET